MTEPASLDAVLRRWRMLSLVVGVPAALVCAIGITNDPADFYPAYLVAYMYWLGIALGSLSLGMIHRLTGGAWGRLIRRVVESALSTVPLMAVLFVPIWLGMPYLYPWSRPSAAVNELLQRKAAYLNADSFQSRAVWYFVIWIVLALLLNRWSESGGPEDEARRNRRLSRIAGPGLILYGLTITLASVDWVMSREPLWYSSIYGVLYMGGQALAGLTFAVLLTTRLAGYAPWSEVASPSRWHDLGNLMLAFVMFWAYVSYMQFLIIWMANLPEESPWYLHRSAGSWQIVVAMQMIVGFAIPFLLLLSRDIKQNPERLRAVAALLLVMRYVDLFWLVTPAFHPEGFELSWWHVTTMLGIGGLWFSWFAWRLADRGKMPIYDPLDLEELDERADRTHHAH